MSPDVLEAPRWWEQCWWRRRSECLCQSPALGQLEEETEHVTCDIPGQEIAFHPGQGTLIPLHSMVSGVGRGFQGDRAQPRERCLPRECWGPAHFSHLELGEISCAPRAPKPWGLWLNQEWANSDHLGWNFLQEREIWKEFRNFQNSGNCKCWPTVRNSRTIQADAILTIFPFVSIIPPRAGEQITLPISHTLSSFQWETNDQLSCHYLHIPLR